MGKLHGEVVGWDHVGRWCESDRSNGKVQVKSCTVKNFQFDHHRRVRRISF